MKKITIILAALLAISACCGTVTDTQHLKRAENYGALDEGVDAGQYELLGLFVLLSQQFGYIDDDIGTRILE